MNQPSMAIFHKEIIGHRLRPACQSHRSHPAAEDPARPGAVAVVFEGLQVGIQPPELWLYIYTYTYTCIYIYIYIVYSHLYM